MSSAFVLLRCIGKSAAKNIVNLVSFGVGGDFLFDAWDYWHRATREEHRAAQVQALAQLPPAELGAEVDRTVREEGGALPAGQQAHLANYLKQMPSAIRRSLRRPSDPSGTTVVSGTVFRKPEDLLPLLPTSLPRFKAGDRPEGIGDWELVELLGIGGFGEVWKARNPHFDGVAPMALKFCLDPAALHHLLKHEAAVLNQVMRQGKHEGIVPLLHTYFNAHPPCLAYEFIEGGDLSGFIQERRDGLSAEQAGRVIQRVAEIAGFAHRLDPPIVHRDLKPSNILVQIRTGRKLALKITDFGIGGLAVQEAVAQTRLGKKSGEYLTTAMRGAYTPLYASPQQMRGDKPDPRDDVYALGVIWYQLLIGDLTKGRPGGEAWRKRLEERGMTPALLSLMVGSFEEERQDRPENAVVLAENLRQLLNQKSAASTIETISDMNSLLEPLAREKPSSASDRPQKPLRQKPVRTQAGEQPKSESPKSEKASRGTWSMSGVLSPLMVLLILGMVCFIVVYRWQTPPVAKSPSRRYDKAPVLPDTGWGKGDGDKGGGDKDAKPSGGFGGLKGVLPPASSMKGYGIGGESGGKGGGAKIPDMGPPPMKGMGGGGGITGLGGGGGIAGLGGQGFNQMGGGGIAGLGGGGGIAGFGGGGGDKGNGAKKREK